MASTRNPAILWNVSQSLNETEKRTARENIGVETGSSPLYVDGHNFSASGGIYGWRIGKTEIEYGSGVSTQTAAFKALIHIYNPARVGYIGSDFPTDNEDITQDQSATLPLEYRDNASEFYGYVSISNRHNQNNGTTSCNGGLYSMTNFGSGSDEGSGDTGNSDKTYGYALYALKECDTGSKKITFTWYIAPDSLRIQMGTDANGNDVKVTYRCISIMPMKAPSNNSFTLDPNWSSNPSSTRITDISEVTGTQFRFPARYVPFITNTSSGVGGAEKPVYINASGGVSECTGLNVTGRVRTHVTGQSNDCIMESDRLTLSKTISGTTSTTLLTSDGLTGNVTGDITGNLTNIKNVPSSANYCKIRCGLFGISGSTTSMVELRAQTRMSMLLPGRLTMYSVDPNTSEDTPEFIIASSFSTTPTVPYLSATNYSGCAAEATTAASAVVALTANTATTTNKVKLYTCTGGTVSTSSSTSVQLVRSTDGTIPSGNYLTFV